MNGAWWQEAVLDHNRGAAALEELFDRGTTRTPGVVLAHERRLRELNSTLHTCLQKLHAFRKAAEQLPAEERRRLLVTLWRQTSIIHFNRALLRLFNGDVFESRLEAQTSFRCARSAAELRLVGMLEPTPTIEIEQPHTRFGDDADMMFSTTLPADLGWSTADAALALEPALLLVSLWMCSGNSEDLVSAEMYWECNVAPLVSLLQKATPLSDEQLSAKLGKVQILQTLLEWRRGCRSAEHFKKLSGSPQAAYLKMIGAFLLGDRRVAASTIETYGSGYRHEDALRLAERVDTRSHCARTGYTPRNGAPRGDAHVLYQSKALMQRGDWNAAIRLLRALNEKMLSTVGHVNASLASDRHARREISVTSPDDPEVRSRGLDEVRASSKPLDESANERLPTNRHEYVQTTCTEARAPSSLIMTKLGFTQGDRGVIWAWKTAPSEARALLCASALATALACVRRWDDCWSVYHEFRRRCGWNLWADTSISFLRGLVDDWRRTLQIAHAQLLLSYSEALLHLGFREQALKVLRKFWSQYGEIDWDPAVHMHLRARHAILQAECAIHGGEAPETIRACLTEARMHLAAGAASLPAATQGMHEYLVGMITNAEALIALTSGTACSQSILGLLETAAKKSRYHTAVVYNLTLFIWARMGHITRALRLWLHHRGIDPDHPDAADNDKLRADAAPDAQLEPFETLTRACVALRQQQIADEQALQNLDFLEQIIT